VQQIDANIRDEINEVLALAKTHPELGEDEVWNDRLFV